MILEVDTAIGNLSTLFFLLDHVSNPGDEEKLLTKYYKYLIIIAMIRVYFARVCIL